MVGLISVIVPVYNVEKYLERCIDSILAQTYKSFELILVDDGSTDQSGEICDEYKNRDSRIVVLHKQNGGLSDARNAGIDWAFTNSQSEYMAFIDSDDFVHARYFEILFEAANHSNADIAVCERTRDMDISCFLSQGSYAITEYNKHDFILSTYKGEWSRNIAACFKLYKRSIFESLRFPIGKRYEDGMTIYKALMEADKIVGIDIPLYYWYQNNESISSQRKDATGLLDREEALHGHLFYYSDEYEDVSNAAKRFYLNQMLLMLWQLDHDYPQNEQTLLVRNNILQKEKRHYRRFGYLCSNDEKKRIEEYIFPIKTRLLNILKRFTTI